MLTFAEMGDQQARFEASRAAVRGEVVVESDARIVRLTDPPGVAVEAWVYLMDEDSQGSRSKSGAVNGADGGGLDT